jgi:hypothetical protein
MKGWLLLMSLALLVPQDYLDRYLARARWGLEALRAGRYEVSLDQVQLYLIRRDPVLWAERTLVDRDSGLGVRLWDYQRPPLRYPHHMVYRCAAESGKTRDVVYRASWLSSVWRLDVLIAAPRDGYLDGIWDELMFQVDRSPALAEQVLHTRVKPYRKIVWRNGAITYLRPCGFAGEPFRGIHADALLYDEAAIAVEKRQISEAIRAVRRGGQRIFYSTPTGDRTTEWFRYSTLATPAAEFFAAHPEAIDPLSFPIPRSREYQAARAHLPPFVEVVWRSDLKPADFWNESIKRELIVLYGGETAPEYRQNVLAEHGEIHHSVFAYDHVRRAMRHLAGYLHLEIKHLDGQVYLSVWRLNPKYSPGLEGGAGEDADWLDYREEVVQGLPVGDYEELDTAAWTEILGRWLRRTGDRLVAGADIGWRHDPSEYVFAAVDGDELEWRLRVTVLGFGEAPRQRLLIDAVDDLMRPEYGLGMDVTGAGRNLEHELLGSSPDHHDWGYRLSGYVFGDTVDDRNPATGEVLVDRKTRKRRRTMIKNLGVKLLERRFGDAALRFPLDRDQLGAWSSYRSMVNKKNERSFPRGQDDHAIDAWNALSLRLFGAEHGEGSETPGVAPVKVSEMDEIESAAPDFFNHY